MTETAEDLPYGATPANLDEAIEAGDWEAVEKIIDQETAEGFPSEQTEVTEPAEGEDESAARGAAEQETQQQESDDSRPEGVLSKDGQRVIPYSELEGTRNELKEAREALQQAQDQLGAFGELTPQSVQDMQRRLEILVSQVEESGAKPRDLPENFKISAELREELGEYGTVGAALLSMADKLEALTGSQQAGSPRNVAQPEPAKPEDVLALVEANTDLSRWRSNPAHWPVVQAADAELKASPEFTGKPFSERIPELVRVVGQRLGEAAPASSDKGGKGETGGKTPNVEDPPPSSLTEIAGQVDDTGQLTPREQIANATDDVEAGRLMQQFLDKGYKVEDLV